LFKKSKVLLADLARIPVITREGRGTTHKFIKQMGSLGISLNIALLCQSPEAVKAAVAEKSGIGILFHNAIEQELKGKEVRCLRVADLPRFAAQSYIVYSASKPLSPPADDFRILLRSIKEKAIPNIPDRILASVFLALAFSHESLRSFFVTV
jgi:DNA-binding transcriptional LysR family regulator